MEVGDGLAAVALGSGGDGAAPDYYEVRVRPAVERNNGMAFGDEPGFLVKGLRAVKAAAECLERHVHASHDSIICPRHGLVQETRDMVSSCPCRRRHLR